MGNVTIEARGNVLTGSTGSSGNGKQVDLSKAREILRLFTNYLNRLDNNFNREEINYAFRSLILQDNSHGSYNIVRLLIDVLRDEIIKKENERPKEDLGTMVRQDINKAMLEIRAKYDLIFEKNQSILNFLEQFEDKRTTTPSLNTDKTMNPIPMEITFNSEPVLQKLEMIYKVLSITMERSKDNLEVQNTIADSIETLNNTFKEVWVK
jgi:hypothetical protein